MERLYLCIWVDATDVIYLQNKIFIKSFNGAE
jgi:hypothetical protein